MRHALFLCGRNRLRGPTAGRVFSERPNLEAASAGLNPDADTPCTPELLECAETVFAMEKAREAKPSRRSGRHLRAARAACLDIPDGYGSMDPALVALLRARAGRHLP